MKHYKDEVRSQILLLSFFQNDHCGRCLTRKEAHVSKVIAARAVTVDAEMVDSIGVTNDDRATADSSHEFDRGIYNVYHGSIDHELRGLDQLTTIATQTKILRDLDR